MFRYLRSKTFWQLFLGVAAAITLGFLIGEKVTQEKLEERLSPLRVVERKRALTPLTPIETQSPLLDTQEESAQEGALSPEFRRNLLWSKCLNDWRELASRETWELEVDLAHGRPLFSEECLVVMLLEVETGPVQSFLTECQLEVELSVPTDVGRDVARCLELGVGVRDFVILQLGRGDVSPQELDSSELENQLFAGHRNLSELSLEGIERNLALSDELISRDPNNYDAQKSKILNLLVKEVKFDQEVSVLEYMDVYEELLRFDVLTPEDQILAEAYDLLGEETNLPVASELMGMDRDLIHMPFLRLSALDDLDGLFEVSSEYVEQYPESYVGYMYLAEVYWRQGDEALALNTLREGLSEARQEELILKLFSESQKDPLTRLLEMAGSF